MRLAPVNSKIIFSHFYNFNEKIRLGNIFIKRQKGQKRQRVDAPAPTGQNNFAKVTSTELHILSPKMTPSKLIGTFFETYQWILNKIERRLFSRKFGPIS